MQNHTAAYNAPRQAGEIDLIAEVRHRLISNGVPPEKILAFDEDQNIVAGFNKNSEVQRYHLNRYWNLQLLSAQKRSIEERYCLIPNGEIADWVRLFDSKVLPFILNNNLPVRI